MESTSVIVPAYGHCPHLPELLTALYAGSRVPDEVIISHSGDADPTAELAELFPRVKVLHSTPRLFAGAARNRGAQNATGHWLAFIDADVRPSDIWLQSLQESVSNHPGSFVVGSVGVATTGGYWGISNWLCEFSEQLPWHKKRQQTGGASCSMMVSATDFHAAGGFPTDHQPSEDTLLFRRLTEKGLQQWFEPNARVDHHNNPGFRAFVNHQFKLGYHSALIRQREKLRGSIATQIKPLCALLWIPRLTFCTSRVLKGGPVWICRGILYSPALIMGSLIWSYGFFRRVSEVQVENQDHASA